MVTKATKAPTKGSSPSGQNKSALLREILKNNPGITCANASQMLAAQGVTIKPSLFYFTKGKMKGNKARGRRVRSKVANVLSNGGTGTGATGGRLAAHFDALATIKKVKALAGEVGSMVKLKAIVDELV